MKRSKFIVSLALVLLIAGNIIAVAQAANSAGYGYAYVGIIDDYKTPLLTKQNSYEVGSNIVLDVQENRWLTCWIENIYGTNMTYKVNYNGPDKIYMNFKDPATGNQKLSISTYITNFTSTGTMGKWSPDFITTY